MIWFRRKKNVDEDLSHELTAAREQLARAEAAKPQVDELVRELKGHLKENHMGDRLRLHWEQSARRQGHGTT